jgi:hypothetical protein
MQAMAALIALSKIEKTLRVAVSLCASMRVARFAIFSADRIRKRLSFDPPIGPENPRKRGQFWRGECTTPENRGKNTVFSRKFADFPRIWLFFGLHFSENCL